MLQIGRNRVRERGNVVCVRVEDEERRGEVGKKGEEVSGEGEILQRRKAREEVVRVRDFLFH